MLGCQVIQTCLQTYNRVKLEGDVRTGRHDSPSRSAAP